MSDTSKKSKSGASASKKSTGSAKKSASGGKSTANKSASAGKRKKLTVAQRRELERQQQITQILVTVGCIMVAFILVIIFVLAYDKRNRTANDYTSTTQGNGTPTTTVAAGVYPASTEYTIAPDGEQLKKPASGEEVAVLETSLGTIKIRLFPDYVPTAVENFKTLITNGYYDGITFHRVINNFMIQNGDPTGTGAGGDCAFEGYDSFQDEFSRNLYNFRGAVSMANAGTDTNSSQFFIVQTKEPIYGYLSDADTFVSYGGAQWAADKYEEIGGTPYLDGQFKSITGSGHAVFGQVYEGLDIVDKIAGVETNSDDKPLEDIVIKKAYLETVK